MTVYNLQNTGKYISDYKSGFKTIIWNIIEVCTAEGITLATSDVLYLPLIDTTGFSHIIIAKNQSNTAADTISLYVPLAAQGTIRNYAPICSGTSGTCTTAGSSSNTSVQGDVISKYVGGLITINSTAIPTQCSVAITLVPRGQRRGLST